jgi:hypothetical protein
MLWLDEKLGCGIAAHIAETIILPEDSGTTRNRARVVFGELGSWGVGKLVIRPPSKVIDHSFSERSGCSLGKTSIYE